MGYRFSDFINDAVRPVADVANELNPMNKILATVTSLGSSLSMPLVIGGGAVLVIMLLKK
jgi:hypothetical protein